ncbi:hypothetical protein BrevBR_08230 [Brevundimonas sp. BR2-1]|uniref:hypothetical protein n=1 Tax=Brevundimonas sp. BR2-1 TaxID=3031123 RepID=UPI0030AE39A9
MTDYLLAWVPFLLLLIVAAGFAVVFLVVQRWGGRISWPWVDAVWVASSAVTLAFIGIGLLDDASQAPGQLGLNNYLQHVTWGRDRASDNLEIYCIGPSRRRAEVSDRDIDAFCQLNSRAHERLTQAVRSYDARQTVSRIPGIEGGVASTVTSASAGQDGVVLDVGWEKVRQEILWLNENTERLQALNPEARRLGQMSDARILWLYVFALLVAVRLGRPAHDLLEARRSRSQPQDD